MQPVKGMMVTCSRCGNQIFLKYLGQGETDGGYTIWNKYEKLPEEWLYETQFGYLCPKCANKFRAFVTEFMDGKVAPVWLLKGEQEIKEMADIAAIRPCSAKDCSNCGSKMKGE